MKNIKTQSHKKNILVMVLLLCLLTNTQELFAQTPLENSYKELKQLNAKTYAVRMDSLWGVVDKENVIKLAFEYKSITYNKDVYKYIFQAQNGKMGFIDVIFDKRVEAVYDSISIFKAANKNYLKCWEKGVSSVFNQQTKLLFTQNCADFIRIPGKSTYYIVKGENQKWGLVSAQDEMPIPFVYDTLIHKSQWQFSANSQAKESVVFIAKKGNKYGLLDGLNTLLLPFEYDDLEVLAFNHLIAKKDGKYGSIDQQSNTIIPFKYTDAELFNYQGGAGPFVKVQNEMNLAGLYDRTGKLIIEEQYLFESFKLSDELPGYSIELSDGSKDYFSTFYNDFELIEFVEKEAIGGNHVNGVYMYTQANGEKYIVGANNTKLCNNSFERFDDFEKITKDGKEFLVLKKKNAKGHIQYGIREVWYGKCMSSIIFDSLDFNITEEHIEYFKPQSNECILAIGYIKKDKTKWLISNFGVKEITKRKK